MLLNFHCVQSSASGFFSWNAQQRRLVDVKMQQKLLREKREVLVDFLIVAKVDGLDEYLSLNQGHKPFQSTL